MTKVSITIELGKTLCSELADIRDMIKTLDFSSLSASVERIQKHGDAMEDALRVYSEVFSDIEKIFYEDKRESWDGSKDWKFDTDVDKLNHIKKLVDERKQKRVKHE